MANPAGRVRMYHNPRCSKSRQTLQLLRERNIEPELVLYLQQPPTASELQRVLERFGVGARQLLRTKEPQYRELGLDDPELSEAALIAAMVEHPILIERPIVIAGGKAALGRPPEQVLEIIE